jgi:transcriptional regulator with XRE-family HTH domain
MNAPTLGGWVWRRRKALDLTQAETARPVPCSVAAVQKIEADERRPSQETAERLAECLEVPPDQASAFVSPVREDGRIKVSRRLPSSGRLDVRRECMRNGTRAIASLRAAQALFVVNTVIWVAFAVATWIRGAGAGGDGVVGAAVVAVLMLGNAAAMLASGILLGRQQQRYY